MTFGNPAGYGNRQRAQSIADRYAPGTQVTVYYNPQNPDDAVLERSAGTSSKILLWVGLLMILLVCIITLPTLFLLGGLSSFLDGFPLAK